MDKQAVRERAWAALETTGAARFPGARGRIPNFAGAAEAADRLAALVEWKAARTIKANPDLPQLPARARALAEGRTVYMAVPRLASEHPFLVLDPDRINVAPRRAASIKGAGRHGVPVGPENLEHIDLVLCGSVAVDRRGARVGKGGGFSDIEFALAIESGVIDDDTAIVTTVHPVQISKGNLPETAHDFRVDVIVTPDDVIRCGARKRPPGIMWDHLDSDKISAIPALTARRFNSTGD
jgi:5-formyltetrahydrofolate cyclo-ligase